MTTAEIAEEDSVLLSALKNTFEPANVDWLKLDACKRCGASTLRTPVFDTTGRIAAIACPLCNYINFETVLGRR